MTDERLAETPEELAADIRAELRPVYHVTPGGLKWSKSTDALRTLLARLDAVTKERDEAMLALPYHGCPACRGAERGPDGVPCAHCSGSGEDPSLASLIEGNLRYFDRKREAAEADAEALAQALKDIDRGLTAANGDGIAFGTAATLTAREFARAALTARSKP